METSTLNNRKTPPRTSFIRIADALKVGQKMSNEEGGVRRLYLPELEIVVSSVPVGESGGGDFHAVVHRRPGRTAVFIGDISGHDFSSTIVATKVIDFIEEFEDELMRPNLFLRKCAARLHDSMATYGRFFTAAVCLADVENNQISYASAGHPPGLFYRAETGGISPIGHKSLPIGFEKEMSYELEQVSFLPGDILLMMTDGIVSARSLQKEEYGAERAEKLIKKLSGSPSAIVPRLMDEVRVFSLNASSPDDETVISILRV